jgi:hypothetical protein
VEKESARLEEVERSKREVWQEKDNHQLCPIFISFSFSFSFCICDQFSAASPVPDTRSIGGGRETAQEVQRGQGDRPEMQQPGSSAVIEQQGNSNPQALADGPPSNATQLVTGDSHIFSLEGMMSMARS